MCGSRHIGGGDCAAAARLLHLIPGRITHPVQPSSTQTQGLPRSLQRCRRIRYCLMRRWGHRMTSTKQGKVWPESFLNFFCEVCRNVLSFIFREEIDCSKNHFTKFFSEEIIKQCFQFFSHSLGKAQIQSSSRGKIHHVGVGNLCRYCVLHANSRITDISGPPFTPSGCLKVSFEKREGQKNRSKQCR